MLSAYLSSQEWGIQLEEYEVSLATSSIGFFGTKVRSRNLTSDPKLALPLMNTAAPLP